MVPKNKKGRKLGSLGIRGECVASTMRLPPWLWEKLRAAAAAGECSMASMAHHILNQSLSSQVSGQPASFRVSEPQMPPSREAAPTEQAAAKAAEAAAAEENLYRWMERQRWQTSFF